MHNVYASVAIILATRQWLNKNTAIQAYKSIY